MLHTKGPIHRVLELFQSNVIIVHKDILKSMTLVLGVSKLLAKDICDLCLIAVGKVFLQLISCSIILQLQGLFQ